MADAFGKTADFNYLFNAPIPFLETLFTAQIKFLKEKNEAIKQATNAAAAKGTK